MACSLMESWKPSKWKAARHPQCHAANRTCERDLLGAGERGEGEQERGGAHRVVEREVSCVGSGCLEPKSV